MLLNYIKSYSNQTRKKKRLFFLLGLDSNPFFSIFINLIPFFSIFRNLSSSEADEEKGLEGEWKN